TGRSHQVQPHLYAANQPPYKISQGGYEPGIGAYRRHPAVGEDAGLFREMTVLAVEFDQRLRMLRNKRDRHNDNADSVTAGLPQFLLDRGSGPGKRTDPALVTYGRVKTHGSKI